MSTQEEIPLQKGRREFLKMGGLAVAGTGLVLMGCDDDDEDNNGNNQDNQLPGVRNDVFDLGGGDLGILTYAYALEQLEAEFSRRVVTATGFTTAFNAEEQQMMMEVYGHEVIHREFLRDLLMDRLPDSDSQLLPNLVFNFGNLDFSDRTAVLNAARTLETTGISAYNGAGKLIDDEDLLNMAGKIVSVEGRHAAAISMMINPDSTDFAPNPLDPAMTPSQVLGQINQLNYITTDFTANFLP